MGGYHLRLVHHSDRGIQYCSQEYQALHQRYGITCSMTDGMTVTRMRWRNG